VRTLVINYGQLFADALDWFARGRVLGQQARGGALVAIDHEVDEPLTHLTGCSELDCPETVHHRERHDRTVLPGLGDIGSPRAGELGQ
jgi:hypothetical protein